jgi:hypothetical protein
MLFYLVRILGDLALVEANIIDHSVVADVHISLYW